MKSYCNGLYRFLICTFSSIWLMGGGNGTSHAQEVAVNLQILSKVKHYYKINLAKNRGCNWYQVLTAFGNEPERESFGM